MGNSFLKSAQGFEKRGFIFLLWLKKSEGKAELEVSILNL
jgi:hypothetical protein